MPRFSSRLTGSTSGRSGVDLWDVSRDARRYRGPHPVVAHPPCNLWVNMAAVNWKRYARQRPAWYPGGDDGGCFASAMHSVMCYGGVLEHPAFSHAWDVSRLPRPIDAGWTYCSTRDVWVCEVWQSAYGHRARKRTWLLYRGFRKLFELDWSRDNTHTHQIGWFDRKLPTLTKSAASATPPAFADELICLARHSFQNGKSGQRP